MLITLDLDRIARIRHEKGWDAPDLTNIDRKLLLAISEITEAQGELRHGHGMQDIYYAADTGFWCKAHHATICCDPDCRIPELIAAGEMHPKWERYELSKPEGFGVEIADAIMRLADLAYANHIDLARCLEEKMTYNDQRPRFHGGRKF